MREPLHFHNKRGVAPEIIAFFRSRPLFVFQKRILLLLGNAWYDQKPFVPTDQSRFTVAWSRVSMLRQLRDYAQKIFRAFHPLPGSTGRRNSYTGNTETCSTSGKSPRLKGGKRSEGRPEAREPGKRVGIPKQAQNRQKRRLFPTTPSAPVDTSRVWVHRNLPSISTNRHLQHNEDSGSTSP